MSLEVDEKCVGNDALCPFDKQDYYDQVQRLIQPTQNRFFKSIRMYALFNVAFIALGMLECVFFVLFFAFLMNSSLVAFSFAVIFLTGFSYFILRLYLKARKPEHFLEIRSRFVEGCRQSLRYQDGIAEHHLALANAATKFATVLQDVEYHTFSVSRRWETLVPAFEKLSCWWHWEDLHQMRELFFFYSIEEHLKLVKCEPTNLEVHAALANAYVLLSGLYAEPKKVELDEERWIPPQRFSEEMKEKFRATAERAIEEFKILHDYAPDDPWVHAQLAYSYHDLQMPEEEIREYEMILKLRPDDKETLFKLGMLYFQEGFNAQGLRIYKELKRSNYKKAENLIKFYGAKG